MSAAYKQVIYCYLVLPFPSFLVADNAGRVFSNQMRL